MFEQIFSQNSGVRIQKSAKHLMNEYTNHTKLFINSDFSLLGAELFLVLSSIKAKRSL
ncbi:MAG: hypothetical protein ACYTXT_02170 [Nostoc sp.]